MLTRDPASDRILRVSAPQLRKRGSRRSPVFSYDTYALIEVVAQEKKKLAVSTAIISHRRHPGPFTLSSPEVFCLIALAIRSKNTNPNDAFHHVRVFAADAGFRFRRLRACIPTSYISSLLQPISPNDKLVGSFTVEQTLYMNILDNDILRDAMSVMFECWP